MNEVVLMCSETGNPSSKQSIEWMVGEGCPCANCVKWVEDNRVEHTFTCIECNKVISIQWGLGNCYYSHKGHVAMDIGDNGPITQHRCICGPCLGSVRKLHT